MNPTLLIAAVIVCLLNALFGIDAHALILPGVCPGQWVQGGGGMMCLCPDGSYANMVGNQIVCPSRAQTQPQVGDYCSNGSTCGVGYKCSWMPGKCVPEGKVDCGEYVCQPGQTCSSDITFRRCLSQGEVDCGSYHCSAGYRCSSAKCIAEGADDCGGGRYCNAGYFCGDNGRCIPNGEFECGDHSCRLGFTCGSNNVCMPEDCGNGRYCAAGLRCEGGRCVSHAVVRQPNIGNRASVKTNLDRVIETLRELTVTNELSYALVVCGVLLGVVLLSYLDRRQSRGKQVLPHEEPKRPETGRVPSEGHAASSLAPVRPRVTSASEPSSEHRDAVGAEPSSRHDDSPGAVHSKAGVKKSPQDERDVALERDGGADKVRGEVPSAAIVASNHEVTTTSSTIACGRAKEAPVDTISAQRAMKLAKSYIDEINDTPDSTQWKGQRHTLLLAAKQLNIAAQADPDATLEDDNMIYTIPMLRARMLYKEALTWDKQDYNKAVQIAKRAAEADPDFVTAHHMLAIYHWDRREKNQALASIDRVLELDPDDIEALKLRDRIQSLTTAEIAAYKTSDIATATYNAGARTFNIAVFILNIILIPWRIVTFPMRIFARLFLGK